MLRARTENSGRGSTATSEPLPRGAPKVSFPTLIDSSHHADCGPQLLLSKIISRLAARGRFFFFWLGNFPSSTCSLARISPNGRAWSSSTVISLVEERFGILGCTQLRLSLFEHSRINSRSIRRPLCLHFRLYMRLPPGPQTPSPRPQPFLFAR